MRIVVDLTKILKKCPVDKQELQSYYNSTEFEMFKKLWFSNFNKRANEKYIW